MKAQSDHRQRQRRREAKLTADDVLAIKALRGKATRKAIASRFGVTISTVTQIQFGAEPPNPA